MRNKEKMNKRKMEPNLMRIGLVNEYFPPHDIGGAEWSTYYLGKNLAKLGNTVVVITPNYGTASYETKDGMKIYRFWIPQRLKPKKALWAILRENPLFHFYSALRIWWVIEVEDIGVLHIQNHHLLPGAVIAAYLKGTPTIITIRDYSLVCPVSLCLHEDRTPPGRCRFNTYIKCLRKFNKDFNEEKGSFYKIKFYVDGMFRWANLGVLKYFLNKVEATIVTSQSMRMTYAPVLRNEPFVVYNSVDFDGISRTPFKRKGLKRILYAGRLTKAKGCDLLLEALLFLSPELGKAEILFAGDGPLKKDLQKRAAVFKDKSEVKFSGKLKHQDLLRLYKEVDLVVIPSRWHEPFGRVCLEAQANGAPVVVTNKGALPELVKNGVTGLIVEPEPKAIASAIEGVLNNDAIYKNLRLKAKELKEKFLDNTIRQHTEIYRQLLEHEVNPPLIGRLGHCIAIFRNIIVNKLFPDECERSVFLAKRQNKKRILFGYVKGIGDAALSIYGFVQFVHSEIPDVELSIIVRPGLEEAVSLIKGIKHVLIAKDWQREDSFLMKPTICDIEEALRSKGLQNYFDIIIPSMTRGRWWRKQFGKIRPELEWDEKDDQFGKAFIEGKPTIKDNFLITIQVSTGTAKFYSHDRDWPIERFKALIRLLTAHPDIYVILVGLETAPDIKGDDHLIDMRGRTSLKETISLIANSHIFIGLDSGLLCLLYYLKNIKLTIISLFGERHGIFYRNELPASKFVKHIPIFGQNNDIKNITSDEVYGLVMKLKSTKELKKDVEYAQLTH